VSDYYARSEGEALDLCRERILARTLPPPPPPATSPPFPPNVMEGGAGWEEPLYDPREMR
jgi:hypothetical protein